MDIIFVCGLHGVVHHSDHMQVVLVLAYGINGLGNNDIYENGITFCTKKTAQRWYFLCHEVPPGRIVFHG